MVIFHSYVSHYQRVHQHFWIPSADQPRRHGRTLDASNRENADVEIRGRLQGRASGRNLSEEKSGRI